MNKKRQGIGKRARFEIFKRDGFACQYCGAHPPAVVLHVDHIVAVANGGDNRPDNLITACSVCNIGKGAAPLSAVPRSLAEQAADVAEREAQVRGYHEVMEARRQRLEQQAWAVLDEIMPGVSASTAGVPVDWLRSVKRFIDELGYHITLDCAEASAAWGAWKSDDRRFRYFCGACWNKIRERRDGTG